MIMSIFITPLDKSSQGNDKINYLQIGARFIYFMHLL